MKKLSPLRVFFDSDVIIAGSFSKTGASHVVLQLAEVGIIQGHISEQVVEECTRNIRKQLPSALPVFQSFLDASFLAVVIPVDKFLEKARGWDDVLVTFNTKDYFPHESPPKILNPGELLKAIQLIS